MASVHTCNQGGKELIGLEITFDSAHFFAIIYDKLRFSISECKNDSIRLSESHFSKHFQKSAQIDCNLYLVSINCGMEQKSDKLYSFIFMQNMDNLLR